MPLLLEEIRAAYRSQTESKKGPEGLSRHLLATMAPSTQHVEVLTGVRRSGKSTLMRQIAWRYFKNPAIFSFEDPRIFGFSISDFDKLLEVMGSEVDAYFFDEVQNVAGWEVAVRHLHEQGRKVYVTGSNASLLSKELGTRLTGRHLSHEVFPFSYTEYCAFRQLSSSVDTLELYLIDGGFPEYLTHGVDEVLRTLLLDVLYRDIAVRHAIRNPQALIDIALYLISNTGKEMSYNRLYKQFGLGSPTTASEYLRWLSDAYLVCFVPRFSYSAGSIAANPRKVYCIDTGFAAANSLSFSADRGRMFENLVYLQLRRHTDRIYYFREKKECDFVVIKPSGSRYAIQVCYALSSANLEREARGLLEARAFLGNHLSDGISIYACIITPGQRDEILFENEAIPIHDYSWLIGEFG
jgi:predicted AAA+ superfamily ATPase